LPTREHQKAKGGKLQLLLAIQQ